MKLINYFKIKKFNIYIIYIFFAGVKLLNKLSKMQ